MPDFKAGYDFKIGPRRFMNFNFSKYPMSMVDRFANYFLQNSATSILY